LREFEIVFRRRPTVPKVTVIYGVLLIVLGIAGYLVGVFQLFGTAYASKTALIPSAFGVVFAVLGLLAIQMPNARKHLMHAAVTLGLLAAIVPLGRIIPQASKGLLTVSFGSVSLVLMCLMSAAFVALCVKSFIDVRKARKATA
jgi:membrane associated rhomboid family serine protease